MLAAADVDVVHNCTPNVVHYEINRDILESGRHVLSEKPLTVDSAQSAELVRAGARAASTDRVYFCLPPLSGHSAAQTTDSGRMVREDLCVHGSYLQDWLSAEAITTGG